MQLRDRMAESWHDLSTLEKKACLFITPLNYKRSISLTSLQLLAYYVSFGPHGPRTLPPKGEWKKVLLYTIGGCSIVGFLWPLRDLGARPAPRTMTKEWQEKSNEYLRAQHTEPLTGVSAVYYPDANLKGAIQSDKGVMKGHVNIRGNSGGDSYSPKTTSYEDGKGKGQ